MIFSDPRSLPLKSSIVNHKSQMTLLRLRIFRLNCRGEQADEAGTTGVVRRFGIIAGRLGCKNVSGVASAAAAGFASKTLNARNQFRTSTGTDRRGG